jgi:C1A family cysteine protease
MSKSTIGRRYGWKPDLPDFRDFVYEPTMFTAAKPLPAAVDLRPRCPAVYDQGQLGSCTANAIAAAFEFDLLKQGLPDFMPSRLFIYFNERAMEGTIETDSGAVIRDGIKTLKVRGVCDESIWPYEIGRFTYRPTDQAFASALSNQALKYRRVNNKILHSIMSALAEGFPVVFGFTVYESFESQAVATTGIVPMPEPNEQVLGGHAVLCVGYDQAKQEFIVRNSWGPGWGDKGYCYFPFPYLNSTDLADDFWVVSKVE